MYITSWLHAYSKSGQALCCTIFVLWEILCFVFYFFLSFPFWTPLDELIWYCFTLIGCEPWSVVNASRHDFFTARTMATVFRFEREKKQLRLHDWTSQMSCTLIGSFCWHLDFYEFIKQWEIYVMIHNSPVESFKRLIHDYFFVVVSLK